MLCKILDEQAGQCGQVVWRRAPAAGTRAAGADDELSAVQARLSELREEVEGRVREAYESGLREGTAAARDQARAEVESLRERLAQTIAGLVELRTQVLRQAEVDLVKLSIEVARRVLHRELTIDPGALKGLLKAALEKLEDQEIYRVRVHPEQETLMRDCLQGLGMPHIEVVADAAQPVGGAAFEVSSGYLDASIDTQLREIQRGLIDRFQGRP